MFSSLEWQSINLAGDVSNMNTKPEWGNTSMQKKIGGGSGMFFGKFCGFSP